MTVSEFVKLNAKNITQSLIKNQHSLQPYTHEGNIDAGVSYEVQIARDFPEFRRINQSAELDYVKSDLIYIPENSSIELKTKTQTSGSTVLLGKSLLCRYKKKNGNLGDDIIKNCPDGMIMYHKFNINHGCPAVLSFINRDKLKEIFSNSDRMKLTGSDVAFIYSIADFEWYYVEENIPNIPAKYLEEILEIERKYKEQEIIDKNNLYNSYCYNGNHKCDRHEYSYLNLGRLKVSEREELRRKCLDMVKSKTYFEISKETKVRPERIEEWVKNS